MRTGHTLVEALCALTLGGMLASASGLALGAARGALERAERRDVGGRAEREAVAIVRRALSTGAAAVARGDTALELDLLVAAGVACGLGAQEVLLPWPQAEGLTAMPSTPTPDDLVAIRDWISPGANWAYAVIDSVVLRADASVCAPADGWREATAASQPLLRAVLADTLPAEFGPGAEVRIYRRGRFALYHAGRGLWMLGWRRCHPWTAACGPIQPVAGPLRPPGADGFRVHSSTGLGGWTLAAQGVGGRGATAWVPP